MEIIIYKRLQKINNEIHQCDIDKFGKKIKIKIYSILEFEKKWGNRSKPILDILNNNEFLSLN